MSKRRTRKSLVLAALQQAAPEFVPAHVLTTPDVGGSEGLRRVRELRDEGWPIEYRSVKGGTEYRMGNGHGQMSLGLSRGKQTPKWRRVLEEMRAHYEPRSGAACAILDEFERRMEQS